MAIWEHWRILFFYKDSANISQCECITSSNEDVLIYLLIVYQIFYQIYFYDNGFWFNDKNYRWIFFILEKKGKSYMRGLIAKFCDYAQQIFLLRNFCTHNLKIFQLCIICYQSSISTTLLFITNMRICHWQLYIYCSVYRYFKRIVFMVDFY